MTPFDRSAGALRLARPASPRRQPGVVIALRHLSYVPRRDLSQIAKAWRVHSAPDAVLDSLAIAAPETAARLRTARYQT